MATVATGEGVSEFCGGVLAPVLDAFLLHWSSEGPGFSLLLSGFSNVEGSSRSSGGLSSRSMSGPAGGEGRDREQLGPLKGLL